MSAASDNLLRALQARLTFAPEELAIKNNREILVDALAGLRLQIKLVEGLVAMNQALCPHARTESYNDQRDSGWKCLDCGASR